MCIMKSAPSSSNWQFPNVGDTFHKGASLTLRGVSTVDSLTKQFGGWRFMLVVVVFNLLLTGTLWQVDPSKRCLKILFSEKERNMRMVSLHFCLYMKICNTYFKRCDRLLNICLAHEMLCVQRAYEHYSLLVIPCIYENILFMYKKNIACIYKKTF